MVRTNVSVFVDLNEDSGVPSKTIHNIIYYICSNIICKYVVYKSYSDALVNHQK